MIMKDGVDLSAHESTFFSIVVSDWEKQGKKRKKKVLDAHMALKYAHSSI